MLNPTSIALLGLKGSGKTTFLAALWHLLDAQESATNLKARQLQPDREYLNSIRASWLAMQPVVRTSLKNEKRVDLLLQRQDVTDPIDLTFPDISGESYKIQWSLRRARSEYVALVRASNSILLFVHPQLIVRGERIETNTLLIRKPPTGTTVQPPAERKWTADIAPTQVQLVEALQFVKYLRASATPMRVGVMVSAWDSLADQTQETPALWLERRLPLLYQYLCSNAQALPAAIFGVSAQGGSYESDKKVMSTKRVASERIQLFGLNGERLGNDLTLPLAFALGHDVAPIFNKEDESNRL